MREGVLVLKPRIRKGKGKGAHAKALASIRRSESAMSMASTTSADSADSTDSSGSVDSVDSDGGAESVDGRRRRTARQACEYGGESDADEGDEAEGASSAEIPSARGVS